MRSRAVLISLAACAALALAAGPATAVAGASNQSATSEYIAANYTLVRTARSYLRRAEESLLTVLAQVRRDCPLAAANSPQDPQSTELSNEVIGAMVIAAYHLDVPGLRHFIATVTRLRFSDPRVSSAVRSYVGKVRVLADLAPPNLCADIRAWVASRYTTLPASTIHFDAKFMPAWVALGELPPSLKRYETSEERGVLARSQALEVELTDGEARAVESWGKIMNELELQP